MASAPAPTCTEPREPATDAAAVASSSGHWAVRTVSAGADWPEVVSSLERVSPDSSWYRAPTTTTSAPVRASASRSVSVRVPALSSATVVPGWAARMAAWDERTVSVDTPSGSRSRASACAPSGRGLSIA